MSDNAFPFDTPEDEAAALLDKLTADQLAEYRARVLAGNIQGNYYWDEDTECGCAYGTYLLVTGQTEYLDELGGEIAVREFFWGIGYKEPTVWNYTPLEALVSKIYIGQKPDTSDESKWLLAQVDAAIARKEL